MPGRTVPLALIYDFDGTLAPGNMQERQFIPDIGMTPADFWREVDAVAKEHHADGILTYMFVMLEKARAAGLRSDAMTLSLGAGRSSSSREWRTGLPA